MFTLRKADVCDCRLIASLAERVFPETYAEILDKEQIDYMMDWMYNPANIQKQMEEEGHVYFIAYEECEACGYISIQQEAEDLFNLQKIYVLPYFQHAHCGRFLFEAAMSYIKEVHPEPCRMELHVNRQNKALDFYKRMGMKLVRQGDFAIGNGYFMNDYIMSIDV